MECPAVRDLLPDFALGTLDPEARVRVERHLAWCAGCRREAAELAEAAAATALALPAPEPPPSLEDRVVTAISSAADRPRRSRVSVVAAAVAVLLAAGSAAWAVAMTGRAERLEEAVADAASRTRQFEDVVRALAGDNQRVLSGALIPVDGGEPQGRALVYDSPQDADWVAVIVSDRPEGRGPYRVALADSGSRLPAGQLTPGLPGELALTRELAYDVGTYDRVVVTDARGRPMLEGRLIAQP